MTAKTNSDLGDAISKIDETEGRNVIRSELDQTVEAENETEAHRKPFEMFSNFP